MIYIILTVLLLIVIVLSFILGKKNGELDNVRKRCDDISRASTIRNSADVDKLRKKYKRNTV